MADERREPDADPSEIAWRGIDLCRAEQWQEGLFWLSSVVDCEADEDSLPPLMFAFLGHCMARLEGQHEEGIRLGRRALELELHQPEAYVLLARTYLLIDDRRQAFTTTQSGLQVDSENPDLLELRQMLGERRRPVFTFLPRQHFLNRYAGRIRHRWQSAKTRDSSTG